MRGLTAALVATSALTTGAYAADKPLIGPAPAWVKPVPPPPAPAKPDEAPVRVQLSDQQIALEPGRQTIYFASSLRIQTPQGLAAGNISLPWRPDTDVLTVHKLLIRRGDETIDVLESGQTFTVLRREQNLESATLDGVLTANIQPEGLQVGDTLELAASIVSSDPTLKGHVEQIAAAWNGFPIGRAHLRMQWPTSLPARLRQTAALPALKSRISGDTATVELSLDNLEPMVAPKQAPPRYGIGRLVEVTDFASWADLGALMAPLYVQAAAIPARGPLRSELERIQALSPDPKVRTEAALALVQDRVRYVALAMGAGGYVPADAATTWSRRYGDCKGKTALLLALLHAMGIEAEPVAVSTVFGDGLDARLPMVGLFNHVLVRASVAGRTYWLDGTRTGDTSLDRLSVPNFGWGLPLVAKGAALVRMVPSPLTAPTHDVSIRIDASKGISVSAPTKVETIMRGDDAIGANASLAGLAGEARDRALKSYWKDQYDFVEVKSASASFDRQAGELRLSMTGEAKLDWANGNYQTDGTDVGYEADFSRDPGPDSDAPFAVPHPYFTRTRETIVLPKGFGEFKLGTGMEVDQTAGGIAYRRHATITDGVFTIEKTERSMVAEFPAREAAAQQAALRMLNDKRASIRMPAGYRYTTSDIDAVKADVPMTSAGFVGRAKIFVDRGMRKEALLDYDRAVELDPDNVYAWANRGMTRVEVGDMAGARSDLARAEQLDPEFVQIFIARGMLADAEKRPRDAIDAYSKALEQEPDRSFAIGRRALAYAVLGDDRAFDDAGAAIKLDPSWIDLYSLRAVILMGRGDRDRAIAEMQAAIANDPKRAFAHVAAARILAMADRRADAIRHYDAAIAIEPQAYIYAERSRVRSPDDKAGRQADIAAALKLDPKSREALVARAAFLQDQRDWDAAIAILTQALAGSPDDPALLAQRARAFQQKGDVERALVDAGAVLKREPKVIDIYLLRANLLRSQGKTEDALREATAAQAADPGNAYSHVVAASIYSAFHKDAEAMKAYDRALSIKPDAYIYLNRSLRRPKTDTAGRRADLDAALKLNPNLSEAIAEKARMQSDSGDLPGAIANYTSAIEKSPENPTLLVGRGIVYARAGDAGRAEGDFTRARALATDPASLNNMCWAKGTAGVALESALADCNAALAKAPDLAGYLDSRGLVLLRLGRLDEAIADYDRALAKRPDLSWSLFGRAVAWARKGDRARSASDAAAAARISPDIQAEYERHGIRL
jgi:tetratricopeptide (TPR) repeat protein